MDDREGGHTPVGTVSLRASRPRQGVACVLWKLSAVVHVSFTESAQYFSWNRCTAVLSPQRLPDMVGNGEFRPCMSNYTILALFYP